MPEPANSGDGSRLRPPASVCRDGAGSMQYVRLSIIQNCVLKVLSKKCPLRGECFALKE